MALTDVTCRNAKAGDRPRKLADALGLYLFVNQAGKYWRWDYRFGGKRKTMALGTYPAVPLATQRDDRGKVIKDGARDKLAKARALLASGLDPMAERKFSRLAGASGAASTFEAVAREWLAKFGKDWVASTRGKILDQFEQNAFTWIGARPVGEITAPELLAVLRRVESRGALETAHRVKQNSGRVFRYAIATGRAERDPSADLAGALPAVKATHHAAITGPQSVGELLRAINAFSGTFVVKCALRLAPLLFVRPGELRWAAWSEFDLDEGRWTIPATRMKMRVAHIVPLSTQAVTTLRELQAVTGRGALLFPGARTNGKPMSENTVNQALRRLGYTNNKMTGHGFRSMASTMLNEQGWNRDAIERQLAHAKRNKIRAAYNRAEFLPERVRMMQAWADYLEGLAAGADVVGIKAA